MDANRLWLTRLALHAATALLFTQPAFASDPESFRVAGYLPDYRAAEFDPRAASSLTDLIVFSAVPTASGGLDLSRLQRLPWAELREFKTRRRIRLILCVGGWERSKHFPAVAVSDEKRRQFAEAAVRTCLDERLDGLDLDWEHPQSPAEQEGYAKLLAELRRAFQPHGLVLSVTLAAWQPMMREAFDAVDWIQIMSYDHPNKHSTFEAAQADVQKLLDTGAPAAKLMLGLPFYGRDIAQRERAMPWREIVAKHRPRPEDDEINGIYFNGPAMIQRKARFALDAGFAGVMVWELGQDAAGEQSLLKAINDVVNYSSRK